MTETIPPLDRFVADRIMQRAEADFDERQAQARRAPYPHLPPAPYMPAAPAVRHRRGMVITLRITCET